MVDFDLPEFDQWFPFKTLISHLQSALESIENLEYSPHINEIYVEDLLVCRMKHTITYIKN